MITRRRFLRVTTSTFAAAVAGSLAGPLARSLGGPAGPADGTALPAPTSQPDVEPTWQRLPRWRGFNLLEKFNAANNQPFRETDFARIAEWGFDFVRLPMDYRCWTEPGDWTRLRDEPLRQIDQAVALGEKHRVHVSLNFHRAPGYTVARPAEKRNLWKDPEAQRVCALHWATFARRYRGRPSRWLSFDLVNEPANVDNKTYAAAAAVLVEAIRQADPGRLIIADGNRFGREPVAELIPLKVAQSTRGYDPMAISHHQAPWIASAKWFPKPAWPLPEKGKRFDRHRLDREVIAPWRELAGRGVGVHVGEWGAFNKTPHAVVLAWMRDCLELWRQSGFGWALWNLRGSFGVLDSERADVTYDTLGDHKLDRAMLELLQTH